MKTLKHAAESKKIEELRTDYESVIKNQKERILQLREDNATLAKKVSELESHKTDMVNPKNSILIDDFTGNLIEWDKKGGISIKFSLTPKDRGFPVIDRLDTILTMNYLNV